MQSFVLISLHIFFNDGKGCYCSRGWKEKFIRSKLIVISKWSYISGRTDVFEVFEHSNERDSDLKVSEDDTIQKLMKIVIQRRIIPNLDLDLIFNMKICGVLEEKKNNHLSRYPFAI